MELMEQWNIYLNKFELRQVTLREVGNPPDPYSMLNPETNSLLPSQKSNSSVE